MTFITPIARKVPDIQVVYDISSTDSLPPHLGRVAPNVATVRLITATNPRL